jgi:hypothetical protein
MSNAGRTTFNATFCCILVALSLAASAQTDAEHAQHHPQAASSAPAPAPKASKSSLQNSSAKDAMTGMDSSMKTMRDMHEKMMAAKTPEERKTLMADHMKAMQDGMAMMGKMKNMPGIEGKSMDAANHHQMMEKRMEMMTSMMQMMMDRMPANPEN